MSKEKRESYHIIVNCKGLLRKSSQCLCQQHLRYGQGGLCDDYCGVGNAGRSVYCSQASLKKGHETRALKLSKFMFVKVAKLDWWGWGQGDIFYLYLALPGRFLLLPDLFYFFSTSTNLVSTSTDLVPTSTNLVSTSTDLVSTSTNLVSTSTDLVSTSTNLVSTSTDLVSTSTNLVSTSTGQNGTPRLLWVEVNP